MKLRLLVFLLAVYCLIACNTRIDKRLDQAERCLEFKPDSALIILNSVSNEELRTRKKQARHALLTSIALDKNYIDIVDDSIINCAVSYYSEKGTSKEKMLSWYYQGIIQKNAGKYTAAIVSLEMAEREALNNKDYHELGLIYRNKSDIYTATNNHDDAVLYIKKAINSFESCSDSLYAQYAKYTLAVCYLNNKDTYNSHAQLVELIHNQNINPHLLSQTNICLARVFVEQGDSLERALSLYRNTPEHLYCVLDYGLYAIALHETGQKDSVQLWFDKGYDRFNNREMTASLQYLQSTIAYKDKDYRMAYLLEDNALHVQDSLTRALLQQSLSNAQRDYYHNQLLLQEGALKRQKTRIICICSFVILALIILLLIGRQRKQMADASFKEKMARISILKDNALYANAHLVGAYMKEKMARLYHLSEDYFQEDNPQIKEKAFIHFKQVLREVRNDDAFFHELEADLNKYCNGIMEKLSCQVPSIKGSNRRLIALLFAKLPNDWIQVLGYKNSSGSLKTTRSRFRDIIKAAHPEDEDLFLDMLEMKKGGRRTK